MSRERRIRSIAGVVVLLAIGGCGSWQAVPIEPGSPHGPRPGNMVDVIRHDSSVRTGRLVSVHGDTVRCEGFVVAWNEVADIRHAIDVCSALRPGQKIRLTLHDGRRLEGRLVRTTPDSVVIEVRESGGDPGDVRTVAAPRGAISGVEQHETSLGRSLRAVAFGIMTAALLLACALTIWPPFSGLD